MYTEIFGKGQAVTKLEMAWPVGPLTKIII